jgi:hypothetical protein
MQMIIRERGRHIHRLANDCPECLERETEVARLREVERLGIALRDEFNERMAGIVLAMPQYLSVRTNDLLALFNALDPPPRVKGSTE